MGFAEQIHFINERMPKGSAKQSLLFSATISTQVRDFAVTGIKEYKILTLDKESKLSDDLKIHFFASRSGEKVATLLYVMSEIIEGKIDANGK